MNSRKLVSLLSAAAAAVLVAPAQSHHSFAMFDLSRSITVNGTVSKFEWTNPHSWLWLSVEDDKGVTQQWGIETGSPSMLQRRGLQRTTFKPGDKVAIELHPMRDGQPGGNFMKATFPDGHVYALSVGKEEQ